MSMHSDTIAVCASAFACLERTIPDPIRVPVDNDFVFRYAEQTPAIVAVQKLGRVVTGLNAAMVLMEQGLYQELAVVFRMLDEFGEDVSFMCDAMRQEDESDLQRRFIADFFQEEFDLDNPIQARQRRDRVPRRQILAALGRIEENPMNPHDFQEIHRTINNTNSGYVHGTSEHILEMYGGNPPTYFLSGMLGTRRQQTSEDASWHYFYRALLSFMEASVSFGQENLTANLYAFRDFFDQEWGRTEWPSPDELIREIRRGAT